MSGKGARCLFRIPDDRLLCWKEPVLYTLRQGCKRKKQKKTKERKKAAWETPQVNHFLQNIYFFVQFFDYYAKNIAIFSK